jgi:hypothetical protein
MRITHSARHSLVATVLALALAACGKDNGPSTFDPQGTSADMAAAQGAFASEPTSSFAAVGPDISAVLNGSLVVASSADLALAGPSASSLRYARQLTSLLARPGHGIQATVAAVPTSVLGTTFVWDETSDTYVASSLAGAPASGVRFLLYAIDPVTLRPVEPVVEVGYVDVIDQSTTTVTDVRVKVVGGSVVYLDYHVAVTSTASSGVVTVSGFASNGSTQANFDLQNTVSESAAGLVISLDYHLDVPSRSLALNWTATFANISDTEVAVTLDLGISGPNGDVRLVGTYGANGGTFTVKVNGDPFATVTLDGSTPVITGPDGQPLTPEEEQTLETILDYYDQSLHAVTELLAPIS